MQTKQEIILTLKDNDFDLSGEMTQLAGDASSRNYWRSEHHNKSVIVCTNQSSSSFYETTRFLSQRNIPVPSILKELPTERITVQQDLGSSSLFDKIKRGGNKLKLYQEAIDVLSKFHSIPETETKEYFFGNLLFDEDKLSFEANHTHTYYLKKYLKRNFTENEEDSLNESFNWMNKELQKKQFVLCHRDYHSKNIMVTSKEELVLIDYQDMRLGLPQYDLVSLVEDCYVNLDSELKTDLKDYYWDRFLKDKKDQTREEFEYFYKLSLIQRYYKAIGSFAYMAVEKKNDSYLQYIPTCLSNLSNTIGFFSEMDSLKRLVEEVISER